MTLLSLVVPVYKVQGYLRECLDSILNQPFTDVEVIAVDDRSPDHCPAILDEYAARDHRVRVVNLPQNVGLGQARNIGLSHATGEYVWFLDSDDWLAEGSLRAVAKRLLATDPDILAVDYAKVWWNHKQTRSKLRKLCELEPMPEVFELAELPHMLKLFHVAWNKVYRRQFLLDHNIEFPSGLYEDVPVGYAVMILAKRISVLTELCVYYRQRRRGAITGTAGRSHLAVFEQYDRLFAALDAIGVRADPFRGIVFERMLYQCILIMENPSRVPRSGQREFLARLAQSYRQHLPPGGYDRPAGLDGLKHRLIAADIPRTLLLLRRWYLRFKRVWRAVSKRIGRYRTKARNRVLITYYRLQLRRPMDENLAVFSIYWGRGYGCNPGPIYEQMGVLAPNIRGVWEVKDDSVQLPPGVERVVIGSLQHYRILARAKYFVNNVNFAGWMIKRPGSVHLSTNHGTPIKAMGLDQLKHPAGANGMNMAWLMRRCDRWDFSISPNAYTTEIWERAYPCGYETLEFGYPRNDCLVTATPDDVAKARVALGLEPCQRVVLYMPTYRDHPREREALLDPDHFVEAVGGNTVLLVRAHHFSQAGLSDHPNVKDVSEHPRVEDLYLAADVLVTDYSSAMFDYAVLDRPIVVYAPDWDMYRVHRGVYLDVIAEAPGATARTEAELIHLFISDQVSAQDADRARAAFRARFCYLDDGHAAERVVQRVFLGETVEVPTPALELTVTLSQVRRSDATVGAAVVAAVDAAVIAAVPDAVA